MSDADGDSLTAYYAWFRNNAVNVTTESLTADSKLQNLSCQVIPFDGLVNGTAGNSSIITVSNSLHNISSFNLSSYNFSDIVSIQANVSDIDEDISWINFSVTLPNGSVIEYNSTLIDGLYVSSNFTLSNGTYIFNLTSDDGTNSTFNYTVNHSVSDCGNYGASIDLSNDLIVNGSTCITVTAQNVVLDCAGHSITGNNTFNTYGIYSDQQNTTIKNCNISGFDVGIYYYGSSNGLIENSTVRSTVNNLVNPTYSSALFFNQYADSNIIKNNNFYSTYGNGINLAYWSAYNNFYNNTATTDSTEWYIGAVFMQSGATSNVMNNITAIATNAGEGLFLNNYGGGNTFYNSNFSSIGDRGIYLYIWSGSNKFENVTSYSRDSFGILLQGRADDNVFTNLVSTSTNSNGILLATSGNNFTNVYANGYCGIHIDGTDAHHNLFVNATGESSLDTGFMFSGGAYSNTVTNSIAISTTQYGYNSAFFFFTAAANNTIANSTASSTYGSAFYLDNSAGNTAYNNTLISGNGASALLYIAPTASNNKFYWNNFTQTSGYYVNNSNETNMFNTTVDETPQGNYYFNIASYNVFDLDSDGWGDTGSQYPFSAATLSTKWTGYGADYGPATNRPPPQCQDITTANTILTLGMNIAINGSTCFNISAQNVTINCEGYSITGNNTLATYGVYSNQFNTTVQNCIIKGFDAGIYFNGASNGLIKNNNVNSTVDNINSAAILTDNWASYNLLNNNTAYSIYSPGIQLSTALYSTLANSTAFSDTRPAIGMTDSGYNNITNCTGNSTAHDGIDIRQSIYNTITDSRGFSDTGAGAFIGANSNTFTNDTFISNSYGLSIQGSNNTFTNTRVISNYRGTHIQTCTNNTFINLTSIANVDYAIAVWGGSNNKLINSTGASNQSAGIAIYSSSNNTITNSQISGTDIYIFTDTRGALAIYNSSDNKIENSTINGMGTTYSANIRGGTNIGNVLINNTILNATILVYLDANASGNIFYWNNFSGTGAWINNANETNMFNTSVGGIAQGNYYFDITAYNIYDINSDGWGDTGNQYPVNATNIPAKWTGFGADYGPATSKIDNAPVITSSAILPNPAYINASLQGYCNATDADNDVLKYNYAWYLEGILNTSGTTLQSYAQGIEVNIANISSSELVVGQNWALECQANDSIDVSGKLNSTTITIQPTIPGNVTLVSPSNNNNTVHERRPLFVWNSTTNAAWYEINITSNNCPDIYANTTNTNFTPIQDLCVITEGDNTYYNWTARACNAQACGAWANRWNFSIEPWIIITVVNDSVNFGSLTLGQSVDTTGGSPGPFVLRNDGNVAAELVNVSATTSLWVSPGAGLGTRYMQVEAGNSSEPGSFDYSASITDWTDLTSANQSIIRGLNFNDSMDTAYVHLKIEVPSDEPGGDKESTIIFSWRENP
jgi:parallel beta-helix repeat protein